MLDLIVPHQRKFISKIAIFIRYKCVLKIEYKIYSFVRSVPFEIFQVSDNQSNGFSEQNNQNNENLMMNAKNLLKMTLQRQQRRLTNCGLC